MAGAPPTGGADSPPTLARMWHGRIRRTDRARYVAYLHATGLADYARTPGNRGIRLLLRDEGEVTHVVTLTFGTSEVAVRAFAGPDVLRARYHPEDDDFLLEREEFVTHWAVEVIR